MINFNKKKVLFSWLLVILWMIIIFWSSSIPSYGSVVTLEDQQYQFVSSFVHVVLYIILTFLLFRAFITSGVSKTKALIYSFLISIGYGAMDEYHQHFVPGREVHLSDWLLDVLGSFIVIIFYKIKK